MTGDDDDVLLQCVICMSAKATMQTQPCGHRVVCRLCFVKTIQTAVAQRVLPLRCVVCRTKILKLKQSTLQSSSSALPARSRGLNQARATRHGGGGTGGGGVTGTLSPRHSATGGSKLMQPLPIYPAVNSGGGSTGGRSGTSAASNSCHHHHLPLHSQAVQRRAMTAWTSTPTPPTSTASLTGSGRDGSLARAGASAAVFNAAGVARPARRSTPSSAAGHVGSPRVTAAAAASRVPGTGHDTKRIQRLKWFHVITRRWQSQSAHTPANLFIDHGPPTIVPTIYPNLTLNIDTFSLKFFLKLRLNVMQNFTKTFPYVLNVVLTDKQSIRGTRPPTKLAGVDIMWPSH